MAQVTNYTSSDGKTTPIAELNNFHLVNAMLKVNGKLMVEQDPSDTDFLKDTLEALKAEVLKRLDNRDEAAKAAN